MQQLDAMTLQIAEIGSAMRSKRSHARERFFGDLLEPFPYLLCIAPTNRNNHSRLQRQRRCPACRNAVNVHKETVVAAHEVLRKALCHIFHGRIHLKDFMIGIYKHLALCAFNIIDGIYGHDVYLVPKLHDKLGWRRQPAGTIFIQCSMHTLWFLLLAIS